MLNAIQFLEALGSGPAGQSLSSEDYAEHVAMLDIDEAQRRALLARDQSALNRLLQGRDVMWCAICTPDELEPEGTPDDDGEQEPTPDDDDESSDEDAAKSEPPPKRT